MKLIEALLYRGDSDKISKYDITKTDPGALFGPGLYLTDTKIIAADYTAARGLERVFPTQHLYGSFYKVSDLVKAYVYSKSEHENIKDTIEEVKKELPNLRIQRQTTGEVILVKKNRQSTITVFDIPDSYLNRTLHAEKPLSDRALRVVRNVYFQSFPKGNGDLRDINEKFVTFDEYVENYKKYGTRYAWEDHIVGGKGENPSLDVFMNGTHAGYYAFKNSMFDADRAKANSLISGLMSIGYVGLEYNGGVRMGSSIRGGGGKKHRAFVFWDVDTVNGFIIDNEEPANTTRVTKKYLPSK